MDNIAGLRLEVSPLAEETFVRLTVPLNPPRLATVMMEEDDAPWVIVKLDGLALIVKSVKVKVAVAE